MEVFILTAYGWEDSWTISVHRTLQGAEYALATFVPNPCLMTLDYDLAIESFTVQD